MQYRDSFTFSSPPSVAASLPSSPVYTGLALHCSTLSSCHCNTTTRHSRSNMWQPGPTTHHPPDGLHVRRLNATGRTICSPSLETQCGGSCGKGRGGARMAGRDGMGRWGAGKGKCWRDAREHKDYLGKGVYVVIVWVRGGSRTPHANGYRQGERFV